MHPRAQTTPMYNSILEAALHLNDTQIASQALQLMAAAGVPRNGRTAAAALRIVVGCPQLPVLAPLYQAYACSSHQVAWLACQGWRRGLLVVEGNHKGVPISVQGFALHG